jgi:adenine/guanine phosphoribosyltransferase-like PRPP-binding protein
MVLKSYPVLSPILMDRKYEEGDTIELEDHQTKELFFYRAIGESTGDAASITLKATDAIALIKAAVTVEEVDAIVGTDTRATVIAAAVARKAELAG